MNSYVVLLRGINVGGRNVLPMKELKALLEKGACQNITSYIQSGNIVLDSGLSAEGVSTYLQAEIAANFGFEPAVIVLTKADFLAAINANPYAGCEGKLAHIYFCEEVPKPNNAKLNEIKANSEEYLVSEKLFYLFAPEGIARSKVVARIDECLGVFATGRNLNTVNKLIKILEERKN